MSPIEGVTVYTVRSSVVHVVRTATVRDDVVGWVVSGRKRLSRPSGDLQFSSGQVFVIPRGTQWDTVNEPSPGGHYEARLMAFSSQLVCRLVELFGQFAAVPALTSCASTIADEAFLTTFNHATAGLLGSGSSLAVREHRGLEVLLVLAERGLVFAPIGQLTLKDRVHRLVSQRPHAAWTVTELAQTFHLSASTLQRRLRAEGTSARQCLQEVRMEAAMALLQGSDLQVSEIAARCGYESHSRFSAVFRQRYGYAPSFLRP